MIHVCHWISWAERCDDANVCAVLCCVVLCDIHKCYGVVYIFIYMYIYVCTVCYSINDYNY